MIDTLAASDRDELAIQLAREVGRPGDAISLAVAELQLDREDIDAARAYLAAWLGSATLRDGDLVQRFVRAALDAEDPLLAYSAANTYGLERMSQDDLVSLAEALSAIDRPEEFAAVCRRIAPGSIAENLLLSAAVAVEHGKAEPARQLLSRIQVQALDDWRLALWARLMASTGRRETAQKTLRDITAQIRSEESSTEAPDAAAPVSASKGVAPTETPPPTTTGRRGQAQRQAARRPAGSRAQGKLLRKNRAPSPPRRSRWRRPPTIPFVPQPQPPPRVKFPSPL
jgi:hypothetical protein